MALLAAERKLESTCEMCRPKSIEKCAFEQGNISSYRFFFLVIEENLFSLLRESVELQAKMYFRRMTDDSRPTFSYIFFFCCFN